MTQKLNWTTNDVANTATHSHRIETIGNNHRVIYSMAPNHKYAMQSCDLDSVQAAKHSVQAAKQWAQNYHNKYGASHE